MNTNIKKVLLIFGGGLVLYWAFKKIKPIGGSKKSTKSTKSEPKATSEEDKKNAVIALKAYSDAKKAGENKSFLDEMNAEFAKEFKVKVLKQKSNGYGNAIIQGLNEVKTELTAIFNADGSFDPRFLLNIKNNNLNIKKVNESYFYDGGMLMSNLDNIFIHMISGSGWNPYYDLENKLISLKEIIKL